MAENEFPLVEWRNPAPPVNPRGRLLPCLGGCGNEVSSLDGYCMDCWIFHFEWRDLVCVRQFPGASHANTNPAKTGT